MNRRTQSALALAVLLSAGACSVPSPSSMLKSLKPYRPDVQQGNIVTKDMVDQLRTGMTRDQVRFLLGTPMLTDIFHQDRWDYPYVLLRRSTGEMQVRKLHVVFAEGKMASYASDAMPTEPLADNLILGTKPRPADAAPAAAPSGSAKP